MSNEQKKLVEEVMDEAIKQTSATSSNNDIKLKIGIIGLGNAGNKAAVECFQSGHFKNIFLLNSSMKDFETTQLPDYNGFVYGNGRGCGKNRNESKKLLMNDIQNIFSNSYFKELIYQNDIIVVVFATAGGTGSGAGPLLADRISRKYANKIVIPVGFVPRYSESPLAQYNTLECVNELSQLNVSYTLLDLEKCGSNAVVMSNKVKNGFLTTLRAIRGDYFSKSTLSQIDQSDTLTCISAPGYFTVKININISPSQMNETGSLLLTETESDLFVSPYHDNKVKYIAYAINTPENLKQNLRDDLQLQLKDMIGIPKDIFTNYGIVKDATGSVVLICSGLSLPYDRIKKCKEIAEEYTNSDLDTRDFTVDLNKDKNELSVLGEKESTSKIFGSNKTYEDSQVKLDDIPSFLQ